jgi:hypothetical protein
MLPGLHFISDCHDLISEASLPLQPTTNVQTPAKTDRAIRARIATTSQFM